MSRGVGSELALGGWGPTPQDIPLYFIILRGLVGLRQIEGLDGGAGAGEPLTGSFRESPCALGNDES